MKVTSELRKLLENKQVADLGIKTAREIVGYRNEIKKQVKELHQEFCEDKSEECETNFYLLFVELLDVHLEGIARATILQKVSCMASTCVCGKKHD